MPLSKQNLGVVRLGDSTTHGGKVISVSHTVMDMGVPIACVGDMTVCPLCKATFPIIEGDPQCTIGGVPMAFNGHKTACGAALISSV